MDIDNAQFLECLERLMGTGTGGAYAAYLNATVPPAFKSAFVRNQRSMPFHVVLLVRLAVRFNPNIIPQLVYEDFKDMIRCLYDLARCVSLGKLDWYVVSGLWRDSSSLRLYSCSPRSGDKMERPGRDKKNEVWDRDIGCVLTGLHPPSVMPELSHIVPYSLAKYTVGLDSPLYRGFRLFLSDKQTEEIWNISGGKNVNHPSNLWLLSPTFHQMYDNGQVWVEPSVGNVSGLQLFGLDFTAADVKYTLHFRHPPEVYRHTRLSSHDPNNCVELGNGCTLPGIAPGDPRLHTIMTICHELGTTIDFTRGAQGREEDLGAMFG